MTRFLMALIALCALSAPAVAEDTEPGGSGSDGFRPFIGVSLASKHFDANRNFQEFNPGLTLGLRRPINWHDGEWGIEVGGFQNSYDERSLYAGTWVDWPVAAITRGAEIRLGGFFAYAEYPQLVDEADDIGVVTIGNFVPILSAQAALRIDDRFSLMARFGPGIEDSLLIVGVQALYLF